MCCKSTFFGYLVPSNPIEIKEDGFIQLYDFKDILLALFEPQYIKEHYRYLG